MPEYQNVETGEIQLVAIVRRKLHTDGFTIVFQEPLLAFLTGPGSELTALELRLYLYLWATVEYANVVEAYIAEIAIGMGTDGRRGPDRSSVSKALRRLEELDLITREHLPGSRPSRILVSPDIAFRGNAAQRGKMLKEGRNRRERVLDGDHRL